MQLTVQSVNGQFLVDSRDVAEMTEVRHGDLLEKIGGYIQYLLNGEFRPSDFFIESKYQDSLKRDKPCYLLTRKGCDMVANKMNGEKGVLFAAAYVTRFEELQNKQQNNLEIMDERQNRIALLKTMIDHDERLGSIEERIVQVETKVEEQITLDSGQQRMVQKAIARKVYSIEQDEQSRRKLFQQLHREVKDRWAVPSYKDVRKNELNGLLDYIEAWRPVAA